MSNSLLIELNETAARLARQLASTSTKVVFAESCTAGMASATLAGIPGISSWLCGSAVVYQESTKSQWLGVDPEAIEQNTAVSAIVAQQMATGVLQKTEQADLAASITGHLGPGAPVHQDGQVFMALASRNSTREPPTFEIRLASKSRSDRQLEAARRLLEVVFDAIHGLS